MVKLTFLDVLFPPKCSICGTSIESGALCEACTSELCRLEVNGTRVISDGLNRVTAYYIFDYGQKIVTKYLFALKENGNAQLFKVTGKLVSVLCDKVSRTDTVITFVPRRRANVRKFGYDHAEKVARYAARYSGKLTFSKLLRRHGFSVDQKNLNFEDRRKNANGKFRAIKKDIPKNILLFDDVVTTGSSALSCVGELKRVYGDETNVTCVFIASR